MNNIHLRKYNQLFSSRLEQLKAIDKLNCSVIEERLLTGDEICNLEYQVLFVIEWRWRVEQSSGNSILINICFLMARLEFNGASMTQEWPLMIVCVCEFV